jgi:hypothetical protein
MEKEKERRAEFKDPSSPINLGKRRTFFLLS